MAGVKGRSGGVRVGAGRKRTDAAVLLIRGGQSRVPVAPAVVVSAPVAQPDTLTPDETAVWSELAPHAQAAGTLTPQTAAAFRNLVQAIVVKHRMLARIEADGLVSELRAHPLIAGWIAMVGRVDTLMARFAVTAAGKPVAPPAEGSKGNPLERFLRRA